jgi:SprT protein
MAWGSHIPPQAENYVNELLRPYRVDVRVSRARRTKTGDFRPGKKGHQISVNGNLNEFHFLWVLIHEIAHLYVYEAYKQRVAPHGPEWKQTFQNLMCPLTEVEYVPRELRAQWQRHLRKPKASTFSDPTLVQAFRVYDEEDDVITVSMLFEGQEFELPGGRRFQRGPKQRTRYKCQEISSGRWFLVPGLAPIVS